MQRDFHTMVSGIIDYVNVTFLMVIFIDCGMEQTSRRVSTLAFRAKENFGLTTLHIIQTKKKFLFVYGDSFKHKKY